MYRTTSWFLALARLRQLIPGVRVVPDASLLGSPDAIAEALRAAGETLRWQRAHDHGMLDSLRSDPFAAIVVTSAFSHRRLVAVELDTRDLDALDRELNVYDGDDIVIVGLDRPRITLFHHENVWGECDVAAFAEQAEDPDQLRASCWARNVSLRDAAMAATPPELRSRLDELCTSDHKIAAIKLYRERTGCGLKEALEHISRFAPWWPLEVDGEGECARPTKANEP